MNTLSATDRIRFDRQMRIHGWGEDGQERLKKATVGMIGIGGLGSPVAIYLAVAGIGRLVLVDKDTIELSNLNRQILHWNRDIGRLKAHSAEEKLREINPDIEIVVHTEAATASNIDQILGDVDGMVDALDNFDSRFLLNRFAVARGIPLFHGAVWGLEGRVTTILPGRTACLRCIYAQAPPPEVFPVVGVTPAVIGSIQATEVLKYFTGVGSLLADRLLIYDGEMMEFVQTALRKDPACPVC